MNAPPVLHGYWRSSAVYRVRIALNLKGLAYRQVTYDLRAGAQLEPRYLALDPQGLVPALEVDGAVLIQSLAIMEWLEERRPLPPLLPTEINARAVVRAMAALIACDIHPLNNLRVLGALCDLRGPDPAADRAWIGRWIGEGFTALEQLVAAHGGAFCFGKTPTLADCCLIPQVYSARRFGVDLTPFPLIARVYDKAMQIEAFSAAQPDLQPDAGPA